MVDFGTKLGFNRVGRLLQDFSATDRSLSVRWRRQEQDWFFTLDNGKGQVNVSLYPDQLRCTDNYDDLKFLFNNFFRQLDRTTDTVTCGHCAGEVPVKNSACPHCGFPSSEIEGFHDHHSN